MSKASAFDRAAEALEEMTNLNRLESRGTIRIVVKKAGFEARSVSAAGMAVILQKLLPDELVARGVPEADRLSADLAASVLTATEVAEAPDTPDTIFNRLTS